VNRERALDLAGALAVAALKLAASIAIVQLAGFRQISDDDYARTVIAQGFADAPRFDPSGTSWLPFPFWITGAAMLVFGRSLEVARAVAFVASAAATAGFFGALRAASIGRPIAMGAALIAGLGAWSLWLGAAPVPEGFTGPLMAIGALSLVAESPRASRWGALALLAASLSRYEAWPLAAAFAIVVLVRARSGTTARGRLEAAFAIVVAVIGPVVWMAWNARAHGSALHFVERVARYRASMGLSSAPWLDELLVYPAAWLRAFPEQTIFLLAGAFALARAREGERRGAASLAIGMAAVFAFLVIGELGDGAPTHHPERALVGIAWMAIALGALALDTARRERASAWLRVTGAGAAVAGVVFVLRLPLAVHAYPGQGEADRRAQVERGRALRDEGVTALTVVPCAYEHFALLAAYGSPERAVVMASPEKRPVTETCPRVEVRR
jgi:hypothetical protein